MPRRRTSVRPARPKIARQRCRPNGATRLWLPMQDTYQRDRLLHLGLLAGTFLIIHTFFTLYVRPHADNWVTEQRALLAADPKHVPTGSFWVIIKDYEQEAGIIS